MNSKHLSGGWERGLLIALCAVLAVFLIGLCLVTGLVSYTLGRMNQVDPDNEVTLSPSEADDLQYNDPELETIDPDNTEDIIHIDDITIPPFTEAPDQGGSSGGTVSTPQLEVISGSHLVNILLVGQDRREGQSRQRSDSMILVTFNKSTNEITLTSFMRDQYVQIPGYKNNKLNAAYEIGGMKLLTKTLLVNFGVEIDGIVEVDFGGFTQVIDLLGGVDIKLTEKEATYLSDASGNRHWQLEAGRQHLTGEQALAYARLRTIDTDYRRAERQRKVVTAVINSIKGQSLGQLLSLMDQVLPLVSTNLSNKKIVNYASELFPMLTTADINTMRIPVEGTFQEGIVQVRDNLTAWFQYNIDFYANNQYLNEIFRKAG